MLNVFQRGLCHPKMAMVIDDRCKVWEDKDQPRVHVVPAFTPYYAPQAEVQSLSPQAYALCVIPCPFISEVTFLHVLLVKCDNN